ncbi:hypothetical protein [Catellatospora sp. NPDC049609]|uniref:golvesin C-terminal-like domain-containing protein n=1 Tax=Catellatospora sp. NPDC049609 TaxID=3155505 RepID=UPI00343143B2
MVSLLAAGFVAPGQASAKPTGDDASVRDVPCFSLTCPRPVVTVNGSVRVKADDGVGALGLGRIPFRVLHDVYGGAVGVPVTDGSGDPVVGSVNEDGTFAATFEYPWLFVDETGWHPGCQDFQGLPSFPGVERNACTHNSVYLLFDLVSADGSVRVVDALNKVASVRMNVGRWFQYPDELNPVTDSAAARAYRAALDVKEVMPGDEEPVTLRMNGVGTYFDPATGLVHLHNEQSSVRSVITESAIAQAFLSHAYADGSYPGQGCPQVAWLYFPSFDMSDACAFAYGTAAFVGVQANLRNRGADQSPTFHRGSSSGYSVETCLTVDDPRFGCAEGPGDPLRITAALWDLADSANETADNEGASQGFADFTGYGFEAVTAHLVADVPVDADELWQGWRAGHPAQDRLIFFMNTLEYTDLQDEDLATNVVGTWVDAECDTCRDLSGSPGGSAPFYRENRPGDYRFTDPAGGSAEISWDLGRHLTEAGDYEVWVRLPAGQGGDETNAVYTVDIAGGTRQVTFNQASTTDGWVRLPATFDIDPAGDNLVRLRNTTGSTSILKADAIILAPNEGSAGGQQPPRAQLTGRIEVPRDGETSVMRAMPGAKWELWYRGKAGNDSDPVQWRPVRTDGSSGSPLKGYLDEEGRFDISSAAGDPRGFIYPQRYQLPDGNTWHGCEPTSISFLQSHACADGDIALRLYPTNEDGSVKVFEPGQPEIVPTLSEFLDSAVFTDRNGEAGTTNLFTPAAHAYVGVYNVRELYGADFGSTQINLNTNDVNHYNLDGTIELDVKNAALSTPEHETAHRLWHFLGNLARGSSCGGAHSATRPSNDTCAWEEGFASFIAVAAENEPGSTSRVKLRYDGNGKFDIELCHADFPVEACRHGSDVEGNVMATLWDLLDGKTGPQFEGTNGLYDYLDYSFSDIMNVAASSHAKTLNEFMTRWVASGSERMKDKEVMWLNRAHVVAMQDVAKPAASGSWSSLDCPTCVSQNYLRSDGKTPGNSVTWQLISVANHKQPASGLWEIWARVPFIPSGQGTGLVSYEILTKNGPKSVVIDQTIHAADGAWINLSPIGFSLDTSNPITVRLLNAPGRPTVKLSADALILTPKF